jgi:hypothetical protein
MKTKLLIFFTLLTSLATYTANAVSIAGIQFDDNAVADILVGSNGSFLSWDLSLDNTPAALNALVDTSPGTYAFSRDPNAYIDLGFSGVDVYNGLGNDLAIFFVGAGGHTGNLGLLDVNNTSISFSNTAYTGYDFTETWDINADGVINSNDVSSIFVSYIDLDILGIDGQLALNNFRLEIGNASAVPALMVAINTTPIPLPAPLLLLLSGLGAFGLISRRK